MNSVPYDYRAEIFGGRGQGRFERGVTCRYCGTPAALNVLPDGSYVCDDSVLCKLSRGGDYGLGLRRDVVVLRR